MEVLGRLLAFLLFLPAAHAVEIRFSPGMANYQFEGAGSSPKLLWESKPTYSTEFYSEIEVVMPGEADSLYAYNRWEVEYLGSHRVHEIPQPVMRKVETWITYFGWGWKNKTGFGFEMGPMALSQTHYIYDPTGGDHVTRNILRAGTYFGALYNKSFRFWDLKLFSSIGVLGLPQRQSSISELEAEALYRFPHSLWSAGFKVKSGLMQLVRRASSLEKVGDAPDAITLFRQGETDTKVLMLTIKRQL